MSTLEQLPEIARHTSENFYWGLIPQEEMARFVTHAQHSGFEQARKSFTFSSPFTYADNFSRADFIYFLPISQEARVLDLGSGFGNVTLPLAERCAEVVAVDASLELLEISRIRARDRGQHNISFAHIDPFGLKPLPFSDGSFDAVILNGVLEWVGLSDVSRNPRDIQEFVLAEVARVLKRGGIVYIGIENRLFPGWIEQDPHSKLPWTSIMPRFLAHWYCRRRGMKEGYRTFIYSWYTYARMFRKHFVVENTLIPFSSYRYPQAIYPDVTEASGYLFKRGFGRRMYTAKWQLFLHVLSYVGLEHLFVSSYMFVLRKKKGGTTESILAHMLASSHGRVFESSDILIKMPSEGEFLHVDAIRKGATVPYGTYCVPRDGREITFIPAQK